MTTMTNDEQITIYQELKSTSKKWNNQSKSAVLITRAVRLIEHQRVIIQELREEAITNNES